MTGDLGEHRVLRELARGGMGVLYEVEHRPTGARRALKTLLLGAHDPEERARFRREAQLLARLDHPAIVRIHEAVVDGLTPYLVQDLLPGGSLDARLAKGPLPIAEARAIAAALARGVEHAHARGVLHRDLKPKNVVFDDQGRPRLVDFGLARRVDGGSLTATGTILGTPGYLAPEQANGQPADARSDVYGLGAVLYAMLVGRPPHEGTALLAVLAAVIEGRITPPRALRPDVPADLEAICLRALATDPAARFPTAAALAAALEGGPALETGRPAWPRVAASIAACAFLVIAGLAWQPGRRPPPTTTPPPPDPATVAPSSTAAASTGATREPSDPVVALARCDAGLAVAALGSALGPGPPTELLALARAIDGRTDPGPRPGSRAQELVTALEPFERAARDLEALAETSTRRDPDLPLDVIGVLERAEETLPLVQAVSETPAAGGSAAQAARDALVRRAQRVLGRALAIHGLLAGAGEEQLLGRWSESLRPLGPELLHLDLLWATWQKGSLRHEALTRLELHARREALTGVYAQLLELLRLVEREPELPPARGEALLAQLGNDMLGPGRWKVDALREVGRLHRLEAWRLRRGPAAEQRAVAGRIREELAAARARCEATAAEPEGREAEELILCYLADGALERAATLHRALKASDTSTELSLALLQAELLLASDHPGQARVLLEQLQERTQERQALLAHALRRLGLVDWRAPLEGAEQLPRWGIEWRTSDVALDVAEDRVWWPGRD